MARPTPQEMSAEGGEARSWRHDGLALIRGLIGWVLCVLFFSLVVFSALAMGGNRDWAWAPVAVAIGLLSIAIAAGLGSRTGFDVADGERTPMLVVVACFLLFIVFGVFQMATFAPQGGSAWFYEQAGRVLGHAHAPVPTIAIDAARNTLLKCLACGAIFLAARALCRDRDRARLLLMMIVASSVVVVLYGFIMQTTTNSCYVGTFLKKVGSWMPGDKCVMSGTFVSSNSFGCYCGMGILAAVALAFAGRRRREERDYGPDEEEEESLLSSLTGLRVMMLAVCLFLLGGLLLSQSRAGLGATLASAAIMVFVLLRGRWRARPDIARAVVAVGALVLLVVAVISGNAILDKVSRASDGTARLEIWRASLQAIGMSPWVGWGLGSYPDVYPIVQPASLTIPNDLAHSTPLETVVEVGVPMALVGFAVVLIPWGIGLAGVFKRRQAYRYLPAAGFGVAAVPILHSMVDFSLQMPAIAFVVSAALGMGWAQAFSRRENRRSTFASRM